MFWGVDPSTPSSPGAKPNVNFSLDQTRSQIKLTVTFDAEYSNDSSGMSVYMIPRYDYTDIPPEPEPVP